MFCFRLTATLVTVMLICAKYLPEMNYGPMWNMVITRHSDLCYKNWWRNLLYIQNLFGFKTMVNIVTILFYNFNILLKSI